MYANTPARVVAVLSVVATLAGCSSGTPAATTASVDAVAAVLADARAAGADPAQIALFADGVIDYADYEMAMNNYASCAEDAGLTVTRGDTFVSQGVTLLSVVVDLPTGESRDLANDCYDRNAKFVDIYWQTESPDAVAYSDRRAKALKPQLQECLKGYQVDFPDDASFDELIDLSNKHLAEIETENCMSDIGYMTWQG